MSSNVRICFLALLLAFVPDVLSVPSLQSYRNTCDYNDHECTKNYAKASYLKIIDGIPGKVETSDPLLKDEIIGDLPEANYKMTNLVMKGLRDCVPESLNIDVDSKNYTSHLICPHLTAKTDYEIKGQLLTLRNVDDRGTVDVSLDDVVLHFQGNIKLFNEEVGKKYMQVIKFKVKFDVRGDAHFKLQTAVKENEEKLKPVFRFIDENSKAVDVFFKQPLLEGLMNEFMKNINNFMRVIATG